MSGPAAPLPRRACAPRAEGRPVAASSRPFLPAGSHGPAGAALAGAGLLLALAGAAGCKQAPPPPPPLAPIAGADSASRACAECHPAEAAAWKGSRHATRPGGPGCAGCHTAPTGPSSPAEPSAAHAALGTTPAQPCAACHEGAGETPCQTCHLPPDAAGKVDHGLAARFDEPTLRAALKVDFEPGGPATGPLLRITNTGAPHPLPVGLGPVLRLSIEQLGRDNTPREGSTRELRLGGEGARLAPGAAVDLAYAEPIDERSTAIRARVEAWPDEGGREALEARLREPGLVGADRLATQALFEESWTTRLTVWQLGLPVGDTPEPPATDPPKPGPPPGEAGSSTPGDAARPRPGGAPPPAR